MFCTHCGKELDDGSKFCIHCGERLDETIAQTAENVKETVAETVEEIRETASETVEQVTAAASEASEEVKETLTETVEQVTATAVEKTEEVKEIAAEKVEEVKETAAETVTEAVSQTVETAPETVAVEGGTGTNTIDVSALLKNKKVLVIAVAAVVVLILLIVIIANAASAGSSSGAVAIKGTYYTYTDAGEKLVFYNGKQVKGTDLSSNAKIAALSKDGSKAVIMDGADALYYLSGEKISQITEDFEGTHISMSADGSAVCYTFDDTLYIYKGGKSTKIADIENMFAPAVISPNGDTVAYSEVEGSKISTYAWKGGKLIDLDAKIIPYSVSNGGGIIYGLDKNSKLCYIKKLKADSSESVKDASILVATSYDCTQILFKNSSGVYYFDSSLKEEIKVSGDSISIIYPEGSANSMNSLNSFIAYSDTKIYSFKRKGQDFEKESIASYTYDCMLSADGKTIVYLQDDSLYKTPVSNKDKKTLLAEEVDSFDADKSLKNIYFVNEDDALRYADGKSKSGKKIIDDVGNYVVTPNGVCVFVDDDNELQYSAGGGERKKTNLEDIEFLSDYNGVVYVVSDGELCISTDGKKFNKS